MQGKCLIRRPATAATPATAMLSFGMKLNGIAQDPAAAKVRPAVDLEDMLTADSACAAMIAMSNSS